MVTGEIVSTIALDDERTHLSDILPTESIVDVEIPIRGLLVKESVVVCKCSQEQIEAQASNISHFCTGTFNYPLFIKAAKNDKVIMCRLSDLLVYSGKLFLNDFRFIDQTWIDRQADRVQPKFPLFVSVINGKKKTRANLFDLSQTGMCILIDKSGVEDRDKIHDSKYQVLLKLPPKDSLVNITGRVVQCRAISNNLLRIGMDISMPKRDAKIVAHYLSARKREILDELFLNFMELMNYRNSKDLYF